MQITKQQMLNGAARYIRNEVVPHIPDKGVRVVLEMLAATGEMQPAVFGKYLDSPLVAAILQEKDGFYDLDVAEATLVKAMESTGGLELTIPPIPLISPKEKTMTFTANDIKSLKRYMEG
jgi:hypothetical protein